MRDGKQRTRRVVVYGRSLMASAMAASLWGRADLELFQVDEGSPDSARRLREIGPHALVCDLKSAPSELVFGLLEAHPGLLVIGVDPDADRALVLSSRRPRLLTTDDLVDVIGQSATRDVDQRADSGDREVNGVTTDEALKELLGRAMSDEEFRSLLLADPARALKDGSFDLTVEQLAALLDVDKESVVEGLDERLSKRLGVDAGGLFW